MASVPETLGEAVPVKGLLLGFSVQKGRASTPQAQPPGDPGLKPDHASLWVRRWLRAAISLPGRLLWHRADLTAIVCNQTSALGPGSRPVLPASGALGDLVTALALLCCLRARFSSIAGVVPPFYRQEN